MTAPAIRPSVPLKHWQAVRRRTTAWDGRFDDLAEEARRVVGAVLGSAGYHRHDRGGWRLRRRKGAGMGNELKLTGAARAETTDLVAAAASRARRSPEAAQAFFERFAAADPEFEPLLVKVHHGNLAAEAESSALDFLGKDDHLRREAVRRHAEQLRRDLLGPGEATAVERVVVDRAVACYLAVAVVERILATWDEKRPRDYIEKRLDRAQRRLLEVLKALDHLRKKIPAVHLSRIEVLGDLTINAPTAAADPLPVVIDLAPDA